MRELIEEHYRNNFDQLVLRLTRQAGGVMNAEDIVQTAFERAIRYQDSFNPDINDFTTWFNSVLRRALVSFKSDEMKMGMVIESEDAIDEEHVAYEPSDPEESEWIEKAIDSTQNVNHRNILFLHFKRDYKPSEIVKVVDENYKNIEKVLERFRKEMVSRHGTA